MAQDAVSTLELWWSHPSYTPEDDATVNPAVSSAAIGDAFKMDSSVAGIDELVVGPYQVSDTISERTGQGITERQRRSNKLNDVADVTVSFVNDFGKANGPADFFKHVYDDTQKRPLKLEWHYNPSGGEVGATYTAATNKDEAQFLVEMSGRPIEVGAVVMGNVTLKYYGGGRVETRA